MNYEGERQSVHDYSEANISGAPTVAQIDLSFLIIWNTAAGAKYVTLSKDKGIISDFTAIIRNKDMASFRVNSVGISSEILLENSDVALIARIEEGPAVVVLHKFIKNEYQSHYKWTRLNEKLVAIAHIHRSEVNVYTEVAYLGHEVRVEKYSTPFAFSETGDIVTVSREYM